MNRKTFDYGVVAALAMAVILAGTPAGAQIIQGSGMSASIVRLDFSVTTATLGLAGSAVQLESAIPGENVAADIYSAAAYPPPPFSNVKVQDDNAVLGYVSPPEKPDDVDGLSYNFEIQPAITNTGDAETSGPYDYIQFSVDKASVGLPGTAVNIEAVGLPSSPEAAGDVFQGPSPGIGQNVLISDEDAQGLFAPPPPDLDELDALEVNDAPGLTQVLYSLSEKYPITLINPLGPVPGCGADIWSYGGVIWADHLDLNLFGPRTAGAPPYDDIDALFVCPWFFASSYAVFFSLAPGSPTLTGANPSLPKGCDPGDILRVNCLPGGFHGPGIGPFVVVHAATIGLTGDRIGNSGIGEDNLDGLDMSTMAYDEVPPTPTPTPTATPTPTPSPTASAVVDWAMFERYQ
jgi:hypothetical protein